MTTVDAAVTGLFPRTGPQDECVLAGANYQSAGQIYVDRVYLLPEIRNWTWSSPGGS
jgi:hypothetical protein